MVHGDGWCDVCGSTFGNEHFKMTGAYVNGVSEFQACRGCMDEALRRRAWTSSNVKMCDAVGYQNSEGGQIVAFRTNHPHFDRYCLSEAGAGEILNNRAFRQQDRSLSRSR